MTKKKAVYISFWLLAVIMVFCVSFIGARIGATGRAMEEDTKELQDAYSSIVLAGYDRIKLRAGQKEQSVYFYNSEHNKCFLVFSLLLDGEELCRSGFLPPNTKIEQVTLSKSLAAGEYDNAILRYSCYDLYTQRELNGADISVKLEVS